MSDSNAPNPAVEHQAFQGFPRIDSPFVDTATGFITQPWQRLLIRLWQMAGGSTATLQGTGIVSLAADGSIATITNAATGKPVGTIGLPSSDTSQSSIESLAYAPPAEPARDFSPQLTTVVPPEPQRDFSYLAIMTPPPDPAPDPLLALALNPLAGLSP